MHSRVPLYPEYGRIEDEEVIQRYKEIVERYKQKNAIVEPPSDNEMMRLMNEVKHLFS